MVTSISQAPSGSLILDAKNILIKATGDSDETGHVTVEGNNTVKIKGKGEGVDINGNSSVKITSDKQVDVIGKTILNLYGNVMDCADGSSSGVTGVPGDRAGSKTGLPKSGWFFKIILSFIWFGCFNRTKQ